MTALKELMTRHFDTVRPDCLMKDAMERIERLNLSVLLVCQDRCVLGMLLESDLRPLMEEGRADLKRAKVREFMSRDILLGHEDQNVRDFVAPMRVRNLPVIPVVDSEARIVGIFALGGPWKRHAPVAHRN